MSFESLINATIEKVAANPSIEASVSTALQDLVSHLNAAIFNGGNSFSPAEVKAFADALASRLPDIVHAVLTNTEAIVHGHAAPSTPVSPGA
jgi:hypothetical protein